jgi:hypothetical protein
MTEATDRPAQDGIGNIDLAEVLTDRVTVAHRLRHALPAIVIAAAMDDGWPDTLLTDVVHDVAQSVGQLDAAAGLLVHASGGRD